MNYQPGLIVCMIIETIASNNSNHLGDIYNFANAIHWVIFRLRILMQQNPNKYAMHLCS